MRQTLILLFSIMAFSASGQTYPFARDFVNGILIFRDSTQRAGQVKWFPSQNEKLKFRETEHGKTTKYSPEEIAGFSVDTLKFVSLYNFEVYSDNYALLGKPTNIRHSFGQLLDSGRFNIYFVIITGYNAIGGTSQNYPNFLFQDTQNNSLGLVAYPFEIRMRGKKYDKAKENLYIMFKDYPAIVEKLRNYKEQDDFFEIINMVKAINRK